MSLLMKLRGAVVLKLRVASLVHFSQLPEDDSESSRYDLAHIDALNYLLLLCLCEYDTQIWRLS
jgi:hypothetical protein